MDHPSPVESNEVLAASISPKDGQELRSGSNSSSRDVFFDADAESVDNVSVVDLGGVPEPPAISPPTLQQQPPRRRDSQLISLQDLGGALHGVSSTEVHQGNGGQHSDRPGEVSEQPDDHDQAGWGTRHISSGAPSPASHTAAEGDAAFRTLDYARRRSDECFDGGAASADAAAVDIAAGRTSHVQGNSRRGFANADVTPAGASFDQGNNSGDVRTAEVSSRQRNSMGDGLAGSSDWDGGGSQAQSLMVSLERPSMASASASEEVLPTTAGATEGTEVMLSNSVTHGEEDDSWESWQRHKRHFFILNSSGKPVFSRYGDENMLAGFMAIIQAIISVVQDQGDNLRHIQAGAHLIVVLVKGPLYLVAVSSAGEPVAALNKQLLLLYHQVIFIVTTSLERVILRNPGYDVRGLLGGTCSVLTTLLKSFSRDPTYLLEANQALPLPVPERKAVCDALHDAVKASGSMYGVLMVEGLLVAVERLKHPPLHPWDLLLLINFVRSNDATYRYRFGESFSPLCMPHFQPNAFLHAYIRYLHADAGICLVLLSASSDSFYQLSEQRQEMEAALGSSGLLHSLVTRVGSSGEGRLQLEQLPRAAGGGPVGSTPLWHFMLKIPARRQVITPALRDPLTDPQILKRVVRAYARQHATVWDSSLPGIKPHRLHWQVDNNWALLSSVDREYELYVLFDPLVTKEEAARISDQLRRYFTDKQRLPEFVLP